MQRSTAGLIVHRRLGDKWNYLNTKELPPRVSKFIESLKISRPELTNGKLTAVQKTYADMVQGHRIALAGYSVLSRIDAHTLSPTALTSAIM
jgi:hypothetical protein